jgi:large subunit ribosomal protein L31
MKQNIHPKYYPNAKIICACGASFEVGSTKPSIKIEICSACHPYFTKKDKFIDKAGRVDRYKAKLERYTKIAEEKEKRKKEKERKRKEAEFLLRARRR